MQPQAIGKFSVSRVVESEGPAFPLNVLIPHAEPEALAEHRHWLEPTFIEPSSGTLIMSFHSYIIRTERHTIVVDACIGNDKERPDFPDMHRLQTPYLANLAVTGIHPEEVDYLMCTHMHPDHVGWNTRLQDGRWIPTFPNAQYLFSRTELETWENYVNNATDREHDPLPKSVSNVQRACYEDSVLPIMEAGKAVLIDEGHEVEPGIFVESAPGHTPGNTVINLESEGASALLCGDVLHHPLQLPFPQWSSAFCFDPVQSATTRRRLLERIADSSTFLMPAHFPSPTCTRICGHADGFLLAP